MPEETVSIRPSVGYLANLQAINYRAWYAMAEFVDNSIQSYIQNKTKLRKHHGPNFKLKIAIYVTPSKIQIIDNAAGITQQDFPRAFRAAVRPENRTAAASLLAATNNSFVDCDGVAGTTRERA